MIPKVIKNEDEYELALARIDSIFDAQPDTPEGDELELLSLLVERYEDEAFPIDLPDPVSAIRFRMEQQGLKAKDLVPYFGSASKASEVLSGQRNLSLAMIRRLVKGLNIPAEVLLREPGAELDTEFTSLGADKFPIGEMLKRNWFGHFEGSARDARKNLEDLLPRFLPDKHRSTFVAAFNRNHVRSGKKVDCHALRAWHIRVATVAMRDELPEFCLDDINEEFLRHLVRLSLLDAGPALACELLEKSGIHVVIERHLPGTYLDGAALKLPNGAPLIALTLRHDRLDNFWFTLVHELGHVLHHLYSDEITAFFDDIETQEVDSVEQEADRFAQKTLIPDEIWKQSTIYTKPTALGIKQLADQLHISPAIPAGRIRFERKNYKIFSELVGQKRVRCLFEE